MTHPRGLSAEEAAAWENLAATVEPLDGRKVAEPSTHDRLRSASAPAPSPAQARTTPKPATPPRLTPDPPRSARPLAAPGRLDSSWDRRLKSGEVAPDLRLDLHDHGLDAAYDRVMGGMEQARQLGARVVLVVTGRPRPVDPADRASRRGAIRAKILDWLAASEHGAHIAAIRKAHRRHGGEGALYIVLRRSA